jgi:hypothetical protein
MSNFVVIFKKGMDRAATGETVGEDGERTEIYTEIPSPFPPPPLQPVGLDETPLNTAPAAKAPEPLVSRS